MVAADPGIRVYSVLLLSGVLLSNSIDGAPAADIDGKKTLHISANQMITDENWTGMGQAQGVGGTIYDLASDRQGNLYAGGAFETAGGIVVHNIARWDGNEWSALGSGVNGTVYSLAANNNGNLYVAGIFDTAGGMPARSIAMWDGREWHTLGIGIVISKGLQGVGNPITIVTYGDTLFAGGAFDTAGGVKTCRVAVWHNSSWAALGNNCTMTGYGFVNALAVDGNGSLYVGGEFERIGEVEANNIVKRDGDAWIPLGNGLKGVGGAWVTSLLVDRDGNLYATGKFDSAGVHAAYGRAKWNGNDWETAVPRVLALDSSGNSFSTNSSQMSDTSTSKISFFRWNGTESEQLALLEGSYINDRVICMEFTSEGELYIGGRFLLSGGCPGSNIARWNGAAITAVGDENGKGLAGDIDELVVHSTGSVYAGGTIASAGVSPLGQVAEWREGNWHSLGIREDNFVTNHTDVFTIDTDGVPLAVVYSKTSFPMACGIKKWNGDTWEAVSATLTDAFDVSEMTVSGSFGIVVGGQFHSTDSDTMHGVAAWKDNAWHALGKGIKSQVLACITGTSDDLYVAGIFDSAGGVPAMNIARWNGAAWFPLGKGLGVDGKLEGRDDVRALAVDRAGNLYAGGSFLTAGGVSAANIAKWDGTNWSPLGEGLAPGDSSVNEFVVLSLAFDSSGNLYAGGDFDLTGSRLVKNIARWDGTSWTGLGSGVDGGDYACVEALAVDKDQNLYVGGSFSVAGGKVSPNFAICNLNGHGNVRRSRAGSPAPDLTCRYRGCHLDITLSNDAIVHISLFSLSGREVNSLSLHMRPGSNSINLTTFDLPGGLYIGRVAAGTDVYRFKVMIGR